MGSVSTCRALVHWQGLLLAVSILSHWYLPTGAQFAIVSTNVAEGKNVRLQFRNKPPNALGFRWFRGEGEIQNNKIGGLFMSERKFESGPSHRQGEIIDLDGTLLIWKATLKDSGIYTVVAYLPNSIKEIGFGRLNVYQRVKMPILILSKNPVTENKDTVVLFCHTNAVSIQWWFNNLYLQLNERMKLSDHHRTLTIKPVKREDAGYYECEGSNPISSLLSKPLVLHVNHD